MALDDLLDPWRVDLDEEGRELYSEMVDAEHAWAAAIPGVRLWQLWRSDAAGEGDDWRRVSVPMGFGAGGRRRLIAAVPPGTVLPEMAAMMQSRASFGRHVRARDPRVGKQSTAAPSLVTVGGLVSVVEVDDIPGPGALAVTWSSTQAWRSGILTMAEAEMVLAKRLASLESHRDTAERARQWTRYRDAEKRIEEARGHLEALCALPGKGSDLVGRISSGTAWTQRACWPRDVALHATPFTCQHVVVLPVVDGFDVLHAASRNRAALRWAEPLAVFGSLAIFRRPAG
ncbi:hypothetical protein [Azospirillum palustre]|nr:hypothetical protein [Azospirillum palustre]